MTPWNQKVFMTVFLIHYRIVNTLVIKTFELSFVTKRIMTTVTWFPGGRSEAESYIIIRRSGVFLWWRVYFSLRDGEEFPLCRFKS